MAASGPSRKFRSRTLLLNLFNSRHFIIHRKQGNLLKDSCSASCFDLNFVFNKQQAVRTIKHHKSKSCDSQINFWPDMGAV